MADPPTTWTVMNDLDEAFNQIGTFEFLLDQLQEAVDKQEWRQIVDTSHALIAFLPPYIDNYEKKFQVAWKKTVNHDN
jgi:hypothetical protein|tara:strand:+ start:550 stop:783 length:234 start_codon:yes stop_codon:yes gene_type:complete